MKNPQCCFRYHGLREGVNDKRRKLGGVEGSRAFCKRQICVHGCLSALYYLTFSWWDSAMTPSQADVQVR